MNVRHIELYTEEWLRRPAFYVSRVVEALGAEAIRWWEGPCDPRAATILLTGGDALVWDEESGWRRGRYVCVNHDHRTVVTDVRYLGGGLLPDPERVPAAVADARAGVGNSTAWRPCYRSYRHHQDGFDLALNSYVAYASV
ncbi:hypothetical protein GCM10017673_49440 [Streptosporangium violaceochromogenes]|nr:hypothetical protein GCM10017673_49440 [Streptosporangium violaceochromogenes]